jgi:hypothetical protein
LCEILANSCVKVGELAGALTLSHGVEPIIEPTIEIERDEGKDRGRGRAQEIYG